MKNRLLIVGCGDIAARVAGLLRQHYRLFGLCRRIENFDHLRALGIRPVKGDLDQPASLARVAGIAAHTVLHLAPPRVTVNVTRARCTSCQHFSGDNHI